MFMNFKQLVVFAWEEVDMTAWEAAPFLLINLIVLFTIAVLVLVVDNAVEQKV